MENFIVSARKYRPATFDTVIGQDSITTTLKNAIRNNQLAQAFLFCGPRGVGKTTCARILAKTINCRNLSDKTEPCDLCESCLSFNRSASFNIYELDAASNNSVEDIRALVDQVRIPPQSGKYKVYIIDEVHMLSPAAFNAFLKTLEEPPAYAKFILATTEKHKILPTILSRCQVFDFKRISVESMARHLQYVATCEHVDGEQEAFHVIAQKADGSLRDALSIFDQIVSFSGGNVTYQTVIENLNVLDYDYYFRMTDYLLAGDIHHALLLINEVLDNGFDGQHFIVGLGEHLRGLLVCKDEITLKLLEAGDSLRARFLEQSRRCSPDFLLKALDIANKFDVNYKTSNNKRLHLEIAIMQICTLGKARTAPQELQAPPPVRKSEPAPVPKPSPPAPVRTSEPASAYVAPPPASNGNGHPRITGVFRIKEDATEKNGGNGSQQSGVEDNPQEELQQQDFTQEQLELRWNEYTRSIAARFPNLFSTLTKRKPTLKEGYVVELVIDNKVQEDEINLRKAELAGFLRETLKNSGIRIQTLINQNPQDSKPYTPVEKFKKMAEINPTLIKFKDQLDLEVDF